MVYGYARVSTKNQAKGNSLEAQEQALKAAGADEIYTDIYTGIKTDRPRFKQLLIELSSGDTLIVTKLDRFARNIGNANDIITELLKRNVKINVLNMGLIDNTPTGKLIRIIFLAFAEFERELIYERTQEGRMIARCKPDYREGRPPVYSDEEKAYAIELMKNHTIKEITKMTGISAPTLYRERCKRGVKVKKRNRGKK